MNAVLAYEKKLYFTGKKDYLTAMVTLEDNYLIWKYMTFLRREEAARSKLTAYFWRRKKNNLAKISIVAILDNMKCIQSNTRSIVVAVAAKVF